MFMRFSILAMATCTVIISILMKMAKLKLVIDFTGDDLLFR
jgi:hypothetical protein